MSLTSLSPRPVWGLAGFATGLVAVVLVTLNMSSVFSPPQPDTATQIGEMAAEIRKSAVRGLLGIEHPSAETQAMTVGDVIAIATPILAGFAALLGAIGLFRREPKSLPLLAVGFGTGAFVMQYVFWMALVIAGACLLIAILNNLESILGD